MSYATKVRLFFGLALAAVVATALACGGEKEIIVEKEVIKEVPVEVVVEKEVVKIVEVPVEKVVEKTVVEVVEVEKEVVVEVEKVMEAMGFPVPGSELIVASTDVGPPIYKRSPAPEPIIGYPSLMGLQEHMLDYDGIKLSPMTASAWELDEVGAAFTIRDDVPWHDSKYGMLRPEDIHWAYTEMTKTLGGWITEYYIPQWENQRVEGNQIKWDWSAGPTVSWSKPVRHQQSAVNHESELYFIDKGEEYVTNNGMGTGPYMVIPHKADDIITLEGVKTHWRIQPGYETVKLLEIAEPTTRVAMLLSGDADVALVGQTQLDQVVDAPGMRFHYPALSQGIGAIINFGGNWRIRIDQLTGEPTISTYRDDLPWVGVLDDPEDMEKARKVRWAMTVAIDREALNTEILGGNGCIAYAFHLDTCDTHHDPMWDDPYDPEFAKQLLAEAGYPDRLRF